MLSAESPVFHYPLSICPQSPVFNHQSPIINLQSSIISLQSSISNHQSPILTNRVKGATESFAIHFEAVKGGRILHMVRGQIEELHLFKVN